MQDHISKKTKRVHTSFLLAATNTGRLASSDPNLQNIPIKTLDGKEIRKAFVADKNNLLISADYNQIEMRILADMADVKELKKAFKNNQDIHSLTASQVFDVPITKVTEDFRRKAKAINFGIIYGITQYGLAKQISVSNEEALSFISEAVSNAGYKLGSEVFFALDVAATEIYNNKKYRIDKKDLNIEEISIYYQKLIDKYPIISIEDPLDEDDWDGWAMLTNLIGDKVQLVGDDLFVTNNSRLQTGIDKSAGNSILIKINQIGSISETLQAIDLAKKNNYSYIISHRSGETEDAIIADISVATNSGQIKTGSCSRTDRTAKYNQLLRIEDSLGKKAKFAKLKTFNTIA